MMHMYIYGNKTRMISSKSVTKNVFPLENAIVIRLTAGDQILLYFAL